MKKVIGILYEVGLAAALLLTSSSENCSSCYKLLSVAPLYRSRKKPFYYGWLWCLTVPCKEAAQTSRLGEVKPSFVFKNKKHHICYALKGPDSIKEIKERMFWFGFVF